MERFHGNSIRGVSPIREDICRFLKKWALFPSRAVLAFGAQRAGSGICVFGVVKSPTDFEIPHGNYLASMCLPAARTLVKNLTGRNNAFSKSAAFSFLDRRPT